MDKSLLINNSRNTILAEKMTWADTFFLRSKETSEVSSMKPGEAVIVIPCSKIQTFGMKEKIDVLFVDDMNVVIKVENCLSPNRVAFAINAWYVVKLPAGTISKTKTTIGDILKWEG